MTMSTPSFNSRRGSSFSNSNLTRLESLVLEVDLENTKHNNKNRNSSQNSSDEPIKECEMDAEDYEYLQQLLGNDCCADCSSPHTEWASVSFGILLCADCSGVHRAMGTHISRVRSIKMDSWTEEHLEMMKMGGNYACRRFFEKNNADDIPFDFYETPILQRYNTAAAEAYKKQLKERALVIINATTKTKTTTTMEGSNKGGIELDETESSTDTGEPKHSRESFSSKHSKESSVSSSKYSNKVSKHGSGMYPTQDEESSHSFADDNSDSFMGGKKIIPDSNNNKDDSDDSERAAIDEGDEEEGDASEEAQDSDAAQDSDNEEDASSVAAPPKRNSLESWFKKTEGTSRTSAPAVPSSSISLSGATTFTTNTIQSAFNTLTRGRRSVRRTSSSVSASAPTITYMGRSFSADGSDDCKLQVKRESDRLKRQSGVSLLSDMANNQEKAARENLDNSWRETTWRNSSPATLMPWSSDKRIEPFSSHSEASYPASNTRRGGRRPTRHESMRQKFAYTDADLLKITQDNAEFARLKAGLKSKGAITNEMLKQRLYAFVAKSKQRESKTAESMKADAAAIAGEAKRSQSSSETRRTPRASKSEDLNLLRSTIHTNTAHRL